MIHKFSFLMRSTNSLDKLTENQIFEIINNFKKMSIDSDLHMTQSLLKYADESYRVSGWKYKRG